MNSERIIEREIKLKVFVRVMVENPELTDDQIVREVEGFLYLDHVGGRGKGFYHWLGGVRVNKILNNDWCGGHKYTLCEYDWLRNWNKERNSILSIVEGRKE